MLASVEWWWYCCRDDGKRARELQIWGAMQAGFFRMNRISQVALAFKTVCAAHQVGSQGTQDRWDLVPALQEIIRRCEMEREHTVQNEWVWGVHCSLVYSLSSGEKRHANSHLTLDGSPEEVGQAVLSHLCERACFGNDVWESCYSVLLFLKIINDDICLLEALDRQA